MSSLFVHLATGKADQLDPDPLLEDPLGRPILRASAGRSWAAVVGGHESDLSVAGGWIVVVDGWLADVARPAEHIAALLERSEPIDLDGEFAFAALHTSDDRVVAGTDHAGLRPLYLARCLDGGAALASSIKPLVATGRVSTRPDRDALHCMLATAQLGPHGSPYEEIHRVPSGTVVEVSRKTITSTRWWGPASTGGGPTALRSAVERAVRLRISGPTDIECSGGLDSSAIATVAAGTADRSRLTLVGLTSTDPNTDEHRFQLAVERSTGLPAIWVPASLAPIDPVARSTELRSLPPFPNGSMWSDLITKRSGRTSTLLSGHGGDELFGRFPADVARLLLSRRASSVLAHPGRRRHLRSVLGVAKQRLVPVRPPHPPWMVDPPHRERDTDRHSRRAWLTGHRSTQSIDHDHQLLGPLGLQRSYPFLDRRVIELALGLGPEHRANLSDWRHLQRELFRDVLPPEVAERRTKAHFNHVYRAQIEAAADLLRGEATAFLGLTRKELTVDLHRRLDGDLSGRDLHRLWSLVAVEAFLQANLAKGARPDHE